MAGIFRESHVYVNIKYTLFDAETDVKLCAIPMYKYFMQYFDTTLILSYKTV